MRSVSWKRASELVPGDAVAYPWSATSNSMRLAIVDKVDGPDRAKNVRVVLASKAEWVYRFDDVVLVFEASS